MCGIYAVYVNCVFVFGICVMCLWYIGVECVLCMCVCMLYELSLCDMSGRSLLYV